MLSELPCKNLTGHYWLDHKVEIVSIKIDALSDKISDNTDWMKKLVDKTVDDVKRVEDDERKTRTAIIITGISVVIGLARIGNCIPPATNILAA